MIFSHDLLSAIHASAQFRALVKHSCPSVPACPEPVEGSPPVDRAAPPQPSYPPTHHSNTPLLHALSPWREINCLNCRCFHRHHLPHGNPLTLKPRLQFDLPKPVLAFLTTDPLKRRHYPMTNDIITLLTSVLIYVRYSQ